MSLTVQESLVGVIGLAGLAKLDHTDLQVVQGPFNQTVVLLIVNQQVMPQRMLWEWKSAKGNKLCG